ncbi:MAG: type II toxin-antitoxin system VapC family toxin [Deltaproteobacteria bacterium]|nr:type II toxin-antitoxin system VapC family toxin [Deltaproteobacteria bacterium]
MGRLFLDANIFLYAIGGESPHRDACRAVLSAVAAGQIDGVTSSEVLQEILHVRSRRLGNADAANAVRAASALVADVLPVTQADVLSACDLLSSTRLGPRDAIHAAVMKNNGIRTLISIDKDFNSLKGIQRIGPKEALSTAR